MTQTTARFSERPVAKAFGTSVSATAMRGLGMSAIAHSRSTIGVQLGRLLGADLDGAHRAQRHRVGEVPLGPQAAAGDDQHEDRARSRAR